MKWYIAKLIFEITGDQFQIAQFDEQWRIITAPNEPSALEKAQQIGLSEQEVIKRPSGGHMSWNFLSITELFPFETESDGIEIFSRIESPEDKSLYISDIKTRARQFDPIRSLTEI